MATMKAPASESVSLEQVAHIVQDTTGHEPDFFDDPHHRLQYAISQSPQRRFEELLSQHVKLVPSDELMAPRLGARVARAEGEPSFATKDGMYAILGLSKDHFKRGVLPTLIGLQRRVVQLPGLAPEEALHRVSALESVGICESQVFSDGNKRLARFRRGLLRGGVGLAHRCLNREVTVRDIPPRHLETLLLLQNLEVVMSSPDPRRIIETEIGAVFVNDETYLSFNAASQRIADYLWPTSDAGERPARNQTRSRDLGAEDRTDLACMVLGLINYGAAIVAGYAPEIDLSDPSPSDLDALNEGAQQLMRLRMFRLLGGIANGGQFPLIELPSIDKASATNRELAIADWTPILEAA